MKLRDELLLPTSHSHWLTVNGNLTSWAKSKSEFVKIFIDFSQISIPDRLPRIEGRVSTSLPRSRSSEEGSELNTHCFNSVQCTLCWNDILWTEREQKNLCVYTCSLRFHCYRSSNNMIVDFQEEFCRAFDNVCLRLASSSSSSSSSSSRHNVSQFHESHVITDCQRIESNVLGNHRGSFIFPSCPALYR